MPKIKRSNLPRRIISRRVFYYHAVIPERRVNHDRRSNLVDRRIKHYAERYQRAEENISV